MIDIRPVDHTDTELLARYHDACHRAELHERPWESVWSLAELRARLEHPVSDQRSEPYAAFDADTLLGGSFLSFPLSDNTDKLDLHVMVPPEHRRQGVGSRLVDHAAQRGRQETRGTLIAETSYPFHERETHGYRRFAERNGFTLGSTEVVRTLDLPVAQDLLDELAAAAAPHHREYRVETFTDGIPEHYLPSYCRMQNQLSLDAPSGEIEFEEEALTPDVYREGEQQLKASGQTRVSSLAITGDHEVVAYTDLVVKADPADRVQQWGTLVGRGHRGHRLGTAVKVANLAAVQRGFPDRSAVVTSNAEVNAHMVDINDRFGFRPVAVLPIFQRRLS